MFFDDIMLVNNPQECLSGCIKPFYFPSANCQQLCLCNLLAADKVGGLKCTCMCMRTHVFNRIWAFFITKWYVHVCMHA